MGRGSNASQWTTWGCVPTAVVFWSGSGPGLQSSSPFPAGFENLLSQAEKQIDRGGLDGRKRSNGSLTHTDFTPEKSHCLVKVTSKQKLIHNCQSYSQNNKKCEHMHVTHMVVHKLWLGSSRVSQQVLAVEQASIEALPGHQGLTGQRVPTGTVGP